MEYRIGATRDDMIWYDIGVSEHEVEYTPHLIRLLGESPFLNQPGYAMG